MPAGSFQPPPEGDASVIGTADSLTKPFVQGDVPSGTPYQTPRNNLTGSGAVQSLRTWMRAVAANVLRARRVQPSEMDLVPLRAVTVTGSITLADDRRLVVGNSATAITLNLPALATVGNGWFFEVLNINAGTLTLDPAGSELIAGAATVTIPNGVSALVIADTTLGWRVTGREAIARVPGISSPGSGSVSWDAAGRITGVFASSASLPFGFRQPTFVMRNNATDVVNDIDFSGGTWKSDDGTDDLQLSTSWTKQLDAVFAEGNNLGMRAPADNLTGAKWFFAWVIGGSGKTSQPFASTSASPTLPAGFTLKRRVGWIRWNGSAIEQFTHIDNRFYFRTWVNDVAAALPPTTRTLYSVTVPSIGGIIGMFQAYMTNTVGRLVGPGDADVAPTFAVNGSWNLSWDYASGSIGSFALEMPTGSSAQVALRAAAASGTWGLQTRGFIDLYL